MEKNIDLVKEFLRRATVHLLEHKRFFNPKLQVGDEIPDHCETESWIRMQNVTMSIFECLHNGASFNFLALMNVRMDQYPKAFTKCSTFGRAIKCDIDRLIRCINFSDMRELGIVVNPTRFALVDMTIRLNDGRSVEFSEYWITTSEGRCLAESFYPALHATLIPDHDGGEYELTVPNSSSLFKYFLTPDACLLAELPLHFAATNGAPPSFLSTLTTLMGDTRSALVRNSSHRLPVDELIVWYVETLNDIIREADDASEDDDVSSTTDDEACSEALTTEHRITESSPLDSISSTLNFLFLSTDATATDQTFHWKDELWDRMWVLIHSAAVAISTAAKEAVTLHYLDCDVLEVSALNSWEPIHAAIVATKYFNYPALALVSSILAAEKTFAAEDCTTATSSLLNEDSFSCLPLHWACGDIISIITNSSEKVLSLVGNCCNESNKLLNPCLADCPELARWNTPMLPCSMIQYLLLLRPSAARIATRHGRLPLHTFLDGGCVYDVAYDLQARNNDGGRVKDNQHSHHVWNDIKALLKACPESLATPDIQSHLYPFQAAASTFSLASHNYLVQDPSPDYVEKVKKRNEAERKARLISLENTYRLILEDPSLCRMLD